MIAWLTPDLTHPVANGNAMSKVSSTKSVFTTSPLSRRNFTRQRRALSRRERQALGKQASLHLHKLTSHLPHSPKKKAKIGIYLDAFGELPTQPIVDWCQRQGYAVFLPVVGSLGIRHWDSKINGYGLSPWNTKNSLLCQPCHTLWA